MTQGNVNELPLGPPGFGGHVAWPENHHGVKVKVVQCNWQSSLRRGSTREPGLGDN